MDREKLSVDAVIEKCRLQDAPPLAAYRAIVAWASSDDGFGLYFDQSVLAGVLLAEPEIIFGPSSQFDDEPSPDFLIAGGEAGIVAGRKRASHFSIFKAHGTYMLCVDRFSVNGVPYACCDEPCMWVKSVRVDLDEVYCLRNEVNRFLESDSQAVSTNPIAGEPGLQKAIALLAVEKAYESKKYRSGNKVNAKAFKDHLLTLAEKYQVGPGQMKSLDDKINSKLKELELKELDTSNFNS